MKTKLSARYLVYLILFLLFSYVEKSKGLAAFSVPFLIALAYSKQNMLIAIPQFVIAKLIFNFSVIGLITTLAPILIVGILLFLYYKFQFRQKIMIVYISILVALTPYYIFLEYDAIGIVNAVMTLIAGVMFGHFSVVLLYTVLVRGLKYRLSAEEKFSIAFLLAVFGYCLSCINIMIVTPYFALLAFVCLLVVGLDIKLTLVASAIMGLGGILAVGDPTIVLTSITIGLVIMIFNKENIIYASLAIVFTDIIIGILFIPNYMFWESIPTVIGVVMYLGIPKKWVAQLTVLTDCIKERTTSRTIINNDRHRLAEKLRRTSAVFLNIHDLLEAELNGTEIAYDINSITKEIAKRCCNNCSGYKSCADCLGGTTLPIIQELADSAIKYGKVSILDTPQFITTRCKKVNTIINQTNEVAASFLDDKGKKSNINEGKVMLKEQMLSLSNLLQRLEEDVGTELCYEPKLEKNIIDSLSNLNIIAKDVICTRKNKETEISLTVKEEDKLKDGFLDVISEIVGERLVIKSEEKSIMGSTVVNLGKAPNYDLIFGVRNVAKEEGHSGDNSRALKIDDKKILLALSDGMGSGEKAENISKSAIDMIECLYKAGYDHDTVLNTVSKLLSMRTEETFNALDIVIIDTFSGLCDSIKLGGRESYLCTDGVIEILECGSLPLGIVDEVAPIVMQKQLKRGSVLVILSDGVTDVLSREQLSELILISYTSTPTDIADLIIENTLRLRTERTLDDATALVIKML